MLNEGKESKPLCTEIHLIVNWPGRSAWKNAVIIILFGVPRRVPSIYEHLIKIQDQNLKFKKPICIEYSSNRPI
jgi:hypothetical protein